MPWSGTGVFSRVYNWVQDNLAGIPITDTRFDQEHDSFADGINNALTKDGQNTPTANLPMAGFKHTNVGAAAARTESPQVGQVQDGSFVYALSTGSGGAYSVNLTPAVTTLTVGQQFRFQANHTNPGAGTLTINANAAKAITLDDGATALTGGEIISGQIVSATYDGTQFRLSTARISAFGRTLIAASDAASGRVALSLGTSAVKDIGTSGNAVPALNGAGSTWDDFLLVQKTTNNDFLIARSTDSGSSAGPELNIDRQSASPAAADFLGIVRFNGRNSTATQVQYGALFGHIVDPVSGTEDGEVGFNVPINGTGTIVAYQGAGLRVGAPPPTDQGVGTINAGVNFYRNSVLLPLQQTIESGELAATASATVNLAHGFGVVPKTFRGVARCKTTEFGYAVGDEVQISDHTGNTGASICADATNVSCVISSGGIVIVRKDTFATAAITAGNWKVVLKAWI